MQTPFIFVVGAARSGTSGMALCLKRTYRLIGNGESHVMPAFSEMAEALRAYKASLAHNTNITITRLNEQYLRDLIKTEAQKFYREQFPDGNFLDKTPGTLALRAVSFTLETFPDAKIVVMRRNGIEVVKSHIKKFGSEFEAACRRWALAANEILAIEECRHPVFHCDQFDMTNDSDGLAKRLCDFIGHDVRPEVLSAHFKQLRIEKTSEHDWSEKSNLANSGWTQEERRLFVSICGKNMTRLGYIL